MIPIDSAATLKRINQDKSLLLELLELFINDIPNWQKKLQSCRQTVVFAQHIHQLKGICQYLTMPKLSLLIAEIEEAIKTHSANQPIMHYGLKLSNELKRIATYYHEHFQS